MVALHIQLLSTLTVKTADSTSLDMGSPTTRSLFAYLVLNHANTLDRRRLAFQFWPRSSEQAARRNLRQYLHRIRRALEPVDPSGSMIITEGSQIRFNPPAGWALDVITFERAAASPHENLPQAIHLYTGDLLEDIYDDWVQPERERLARLYRECLLRLIDQQEAAGQATKAIANAERYLAAEPYLESAHIRLMRLYYAAGDRARVRQHYEQLATILQEELGAEPMPETIAIYEAMLAGDYNSQTIGANQIPATPALPPSVPVVQQPAAPLVERLAAPAARPARLLPRPKPVCAKRTVSCYRGDRQSHLRFGAAAAAHSLSG